MARFIVPLRKLCRLNYDFIMVLLSLLFFILSATCFGEFSKYYCNIIKKKRNRKCFQAKARKWPMRAALGASWQLPWSPLGQFFIAFWLSLGLYFERYILNKGKEFKLKIYKKKY